MHQFAEDLWRGANVYLKERLRDASRLAREFSNAEFFLVTIDSDTMFVPLAWATSALAPDWTTWSASENTGHAQRKAQEAGLQKIVAGHDLHEELWKASVSMCEELRTTHSPNLSSGFSKRNGKAREPHHNTYFLYPREIGDNYVAPNKSETEFLAQVHSSSQENRETRLNRLRNAPKKPKKRLILTSELVRNSDVVAERLFIANGVCEKCHKSAPFRKRGDQTPYLEVHHVVWLSKGGEDTVENTLALCPNCHREAHHG